MIMAKKTAKTKAADPIMAEEIAVETSKIADSAREFVKRTAASAKERAENLHEGSNTINAGVEKNLNRMVSGYVSVLGGIADATFANVDHALSTVEKLAGAKSVSEALQIQSDYVRDSANSNMERARDAAETVREVVVENVSDFRNQAAKIWPYGTKAA